MNNKELGKCPSCKKFLNSADIEKVKIDYAIIAVCKKCNTIISVYGKI